MVKKMTAVFHYLLNFIYNLQFKNCFEETAWAHPYPWPVKESNLDSLKMNSHCPVRHKRFSCLEVRTVFTNIKQMFIEDHYAVFNVCKHLWTLNEGPGFEPRVGSPRIFKVEFHQQKLSSLSMPCNIKLNPASMETSNRCLFYIKCT